MTAFHMRCETAIMYDVLLKRLTYQAAGINGTIHDDE